MNSPQLCTHTFFNLVSDCLYDSGTVALTQFLSGLQVVTGRLHLLLLKCHHGILQKRFVHDISFKNAVMLYFIILISNDLVFQSRSMLELAYKHLVLSGKECYIMVLKRTKGSFCIIMNGGTQ